jgi:hypothetical protein
MHATLKFNLPEETTEHLWATNGGRMASAICEVLDKTRSWLKHGHEFKSPEEAIQGCRELLLDVAEIARGDP